MINLVKDLMDQSDSVWGCMHKMLYLAQNDISERQVDWARVVNSRVMDHHFLHPSHS